MPSSSGCWRVGLSCSEPPGRTLTLIEQPGYYAAFETIFAEAAGRTRIRLAAYCLMPNHWHVLLWPRHDGELSEVVRWITVTHTQRWHAHRKTAGTGPVYQGRFTSFPVQTEEHIRTVPQYVERNARRATLVSRAEEWQWRSVWRWTQGDPELSASLSNWHSTHRETGWHESTGPTRRRNSSRCAWVCNEGVPSGRRPG